MLKATWRLAMMLVGGGMLCLWFALAGIWVRSYWRGDVITLVVSGDDMAARPSAYPLYGSRSVLLVSGDGGVCVAIREAARFYEPYVSAKRWEVFKDPSYPAPATPALAVAAAAPPPATMPTVVEGRVRSFRAAPQSNFLRVSQDGRVTTVAAPAVAGMNSVIAPPSTPWTSSPFMLYESGTPIGSVLPTGDITRVAILPWWAVIAPLTVISILPAAFLKRNLRRRWWMQQGRCPKCGYDLRATPDRCPECGTAAKMG